MNRGVWVTGGLCWLAAVLIFAAILIFVMGYDFGRAFVTSAICWLFAVLYALLRFGLFRLGILLGWRTPIWPFSPFRFF
jgi:hypothetical protein